MRKRSEFEEILDTLHKELSETLLAKIRSGEATATDLNVIRQFLKDNGIQASNSPEEPLRHLAAELPWDVDDKVYTGSPFAH